MTFVHSSRICCYLATTARPPRIRATSPAAAWRALSLSLRYRSATTSSGTFKINRKMIIADARKMAGHSLST